MIRCRQEGRASSHQATSKTRWPLVFSLASVPQAVHGDRIPSIPENRLSEDIRRGR